MGDLSSNVPCQNQCGNLSHVAERSMGHEGSKDKMTTRTRAAQDSLHNKYTRCLRKNCAKLFLSELPQIFINFNDFGNLDEKMAEILCYIYIFHLTSPHSRYRTTLLNTKVQNFTVSQENCETILSELCSISINLIIFGRYMTK